MNFIDSTTIRAAAKEDAAEIVDLLHLSWLATYVPLGVPESVVQDMFSNREERILSWSEYISKIDATSDIGLVSLVDKKVVGMCFGRRTDGGYVLSQIYVHPNFIGCGIGSQLITTFFDRAKGSLVKVSVFDKNLPAIKFYKKHDFYETEETSQFVVSHALSLNEKILYRIA